MLTQRQRQIVATAIKIIAEKGIQHLTIKNLAGAIGISEAAIYRHFKSKHSILMAILDSFRDFSSFALDEKSRNLSALEKIKLFLDDRYHKFSNYPEMASVMFGEEIFQFDIELSQKLLSIIHSHGEALQEIIRKGQEDREIRVDVEPQAMFKVLVGSMRLLVNQWCLSGFRFDLIEAGDRLWNNLKKMLA